MSRAPIEFVLQDADGKDQQYSIVPHPGSEALTLVWRIIHVASKPLARLLEGNLGRLLEALSSDQNVDAAELVDELDLQLSSALGDVFAILQEAGPEIITRELLIHTYRNGRSLKQTKNFDDAFTANYGEMLQACSKAVKVNRFLDLFRTSFGSLVQARAPETTESGNGINSLEQLAQLASTGSSGVSGSPASSA
jgi:hypothetical protein